ncbi:MAG: hypothetical protein MJZ28_12890, partial [Paludibacteraceae bacterium]|nr:hypothetical protein [Paludibacteraceae bacterium]
MKTRKMLKKACGVVALLFMTSNASAQWGGGGGGASLPLVAETDFSYSEGAADYWHSLDMVDGYGNSLFVPTFAVGSSFKTPKDTKADATKSTFFDNQSYALTPNPIRLDSLRLADDGADENNKNPNWGIVFSGGSRGLSGNTLAFSMTVPGLKNGGAYRVEVEYCNPLSAAYLETSGSAPKPHMSSGYSTQIKIGTNATQVDGVQTTALQSKTGCAKATVSNPTNYNNTQGAISGGTLKVDVIINQMPAGQAIMIRSVKVYAELEAKITGETEVCAGGANAALSLSNIFLNSKYQWYKNGQAVAGANSSSVTHESGMEVNKEHSYYCEVTTPSGTKVKTETFKIKDIECCSDKNGNPADQKMIWKDDFGTFTSATSYWVWDYTDIANPKKVTKNDAKKWQRPLDVAPEGAHFAVVGGDGDCDCPQVYSYTQDVNKFIEGYYTVAGNVTSYGMNGGNNMGWVGYFGNGVEPSKNGFAFAPDHTYNGSDYGGMLYLNVGSDPGAVIYKRKITGLCDRHITLKCYLNCFSRSELNPISVFLRITDTKSGDIKESPVYTRYANNTNNTYGVGWVPASVSIDLTGTELEFEIISKTGGATQNKDGNDLILDDIEIWACAAPSVNMYFDLDTHSIEEESCLADDIKLVVEKSKMIETNLGTDARFLFQYSQTPDDLKSWKNLGTVTKEVEYTQLQSLVEQLKLADGDKVSFRVVLGLESILTTETFFNPNEPCGAYSVSEPILLNIKCPKCEKPIDPEITAKGGTVAAGTVNLCEGESTVLSSNSIYGSEDKTYVDYSISWSRVGADGTPTSVGKKVQSGTKAEDLTIDWADAEATGTTYILTVHDNFENANGTKNCDKTAEIVVYANPTPIAPTIEKQEFCENATVKPTIAALTSAAGFASYDITWTQPTATAVDIASLTAGTTTIGYTVTDKVTGCVSEEATFDVEVNSVPVLTVPPVEEFCAGQTTVVLPTTGVDEVTGDAVTIDWNNKETDLSQLSGSTDLYLYPYVVSNAAGCKQEEKSIEINAKLAVKIDLLEATVECGLTTLNVSINPATATRKWDLDGTLLDPTFAEKWADEYVVGDLTLSVELAGYCPSDKTIHVETKVAPVVLETSPVSYVKKTQAQKNVDLFEASGNLTPKISEGNELADLKLQFTKKAYPSEIDPNTLTDADFDAPDVYPVPQATDVNDVNPEVQYYYVRVYNATTGCHSVPAVIRVDFFGAPVPDVVNGIYCKGTDAKTLADYVKVNQTADPTAEYTLKYYKDATKAAASELPGTTQPSTAVAGVVSYFATQSSEAGGESDPVEFTITTVDVKAPLVAENAKSLDYCLNDQASVLVADKVIDEQGWYLSDGLQWSSNGTSWSSEAIVPSTSATGTSTYSVRQHYVISSTTEECLGEPVDITVTVSETTVPTGLLSVAYLYSDLENNGSFENILAKDANTVNIEEGYTYYYAECDAAGTVSGSWNTTIPTPANVTKEELDGGSKTVYYAVKRVSNSGAKCESEPVVITVTISDSPMPVTIPAYFCEGEEIPSLDQFVSISSANKSADHYELLWYGTTKPSSSQMESGSTTVSASPAATVVDAKNTNVMYYYVAQRDLDTKAIGSPSTLTITVYPKPVLSITDPDVVCSATVDLQSSVELTNFMAGASYTTKFYSDAAGTTEISASVSETGTYYTQMSFPTMGASISGSVCKSDVKGISVKIDELTMTSA